MDKQQRWPVADVGDREATVVVVRVRTSATAMPAKSASVADRSQEGFSRLYLSI